MLAKQQRLTKAEFDVAFKSGKRSHTPILQLIYTPGMSFHGAVVVGKKVYKKAVDRNRLRRRLYGVLYNLHQSSGLKGTYIVIVKPSATTLPYQVVRNDLVQVVGRVGKTG